MPCHLIGRLGDITKNSLTGFIIRFVRRPHLETERFLQIKANVHINRSVHGVTYCGYRILPGAFKLTFRKKRRYQQLRKRWEASWQAGEINSLKLQQAYDAVHAITLHTDSLAWRKRSLQLHPSCYITHLGDD